MENTNVLRCKSIAEKLEAFVGTEMYRCPKCGEYICFDNEQYSDTDSSYTCQECGETIGEDTLEPASMSDYLADMDMFDVEYRIGGDMMYRSVVFMVACGGPNIYVDTRKKAVLLFWGGERAEYPLSSRACEEIDEYFEELYQC